MLLEFTLRNYKLFGGETVFSMEPAPKQKGLDYSIYSAEFGKNRYRCLSSAVIYGPNAAGKTTLIGAMDTFRAIVSRGGIRDAPEQMGLNRAASHLSLIPNSLLKEPMPTLLRMKFADKSLFEYSLEFDVGRFSDLDSPRVILEEYLKVNEQTVFLRRPNHIEIETSPISDQLAKGLEGRESAVADLAANLAPTELFLTGVFKTFVSPQVASQVLDWFERKLMVVYRADRVRSVYRPSNLIRSTPYIEKAVDEVAHAFGIGPNAVGYMIPEGETEPRLFSFFREGSGGGKALLAEDYESYGTVRFIDMFPLVAEALRTGATLAVDEFDASIHPMALMSILSIFHNDEVNTKGAQLIFDTHNPVFLNGNVLRRDEIKFVERDKDTGLAQHYSLSDFGTSGAGGVRQGQDYMKGYFMDKYGAIEDIDFTPAFDHMVKRASEGK